MTQNVHQVGLSVKRLQARHHRAIETALAPYGISLVQWDALRHLDQNPGSSLHDLAVLTFQTDQSFGTLAARMVERGLIERVPGPGRAVHHRITDKGHALQRKGGAVVEEVLTASLAALSPTELATLSQLLCKLLKAPASTEPAS